MAAPRSPPRAILSVAEFPPAPLPRLAAPLPRYPAAGEGGSGRTGARGGGDSGAAAACTGVGAGQLPSLELEEGGAGGRGAARRPGCVLVTVKSANG